MTRQNLMNVGRTMVLPVSRLLRGGAVVALALSTSGALTGCALVGDDAQSGQSGVAGASGEQAMSTPAEKVMSGEYEVGPDGKLLNPNRNLNLTPPQLPELAKEHSKEGAEAFARYYLEVLPYVWMTGDTQAIRSLAHSECTYCVELSKILDDMHAEGGWAASASYQLNSLGPTFEIPDHPGIWNVDVNITRSSATFYNGRSLNNADERTENVHIQLQYERGQWRLWAVGQK